MIELFEVQRAMRQMRKAAMQRGVIAILDIGTSKATCLVLRFDGGELPATEGVGPSMLSRCSSACRGEVMTLGIATGEASDRAGSVTPSSWAGGSKPICGPS